MKRASSGAVVFAVSFAAAIAGCAVYRGPRIAARDAAAPPAPVARAEPERGDVERERSDIRERAIADYEDILRRYAGAGRDEIDEALYHLEHLLFERERRAYENVLASAESSSAPPKPRYPGARAVAERLVREFPNSSLSEDALYDLAYMRFEEGDRAGASELFERLIHAHPMSRYADEAHFRIAEYAFDTNRLADAEKHYLLALHRGITAFTPKALFKLGWTYYDAGRFDEAKRTLATLLAGEMRDRERGDREYCPPPIFMFPGPRRPTPNRMRDLAGVGLYEDTLDAIARVYAEAGGMRALVEFVSAQMKDGKPPRYAPALFHRLALVQKEHSSLTEAAGTYRRLLDQFPEYRGAPRATKELAEILAAEHGVEEAAHVRSEMADRYAAGSTWARANPEEEYRKTALRIARDSLAASIRDFHSRGLDEQRQQGGVPEDLRRSIALYEKYLSRFPDGRKSYETRFLYAQALYAAGQYREAADTFRVVASDERFGDHREAAAYSRILTISKLAEGSDPLPATVIEPLLAAYDDYVTLNPQSEKNAEILFKEAEMYARAERYPEAIAAYERLVSTYPAHRLTPEARELLASAEFRAGDFPAAERWSEKALAAAAGPDRSASRPRQIEDLYALAIFKQGEKAEEERRFSEAAGHYQRLVDRMPASPVAVRALYNAGGARDRAGDHEAAAALFAELARRHPESDLAPDAAVRLAELAKDRPNGVNQILQAYEEVADHRVEGASGEELLFLAGRLAAKEHRNSDAARLFEKFLARYPSTAFDERGRRNLEAHYHLGVAAAELGRTAAARKELEFFVSRATAAKAGFGSDPGGDAFAVARANLILGDSLADDFRRLRVVPPIAETLRRKQRLLDELLTRYVPAMTSGLSPIATKASYAIGQAYEEFVQSLIDAPRPGGLKADEAAEYDQLLTQKTRPYIRKAVDVYRTVVRAARTGLTDEWVTPCAERLAVLAEGAYGRAPRPSYVRLPSAGGSDAGSTPSATASREELASLVAVVRESPPRLVEVGIVAAERGAADVAAEAFAAARARITPSDQQALGVVLNDQALAALTLGRTAEAESLAAASRLAAPALAAAANTAGMIEMRKKNFDAAGREFRAAIAADPTLAAGWVNLGILQELYDGTFGDAIASYRRYVAMRPADEQVVTGWIREIEDAQSGVAASMPNPPPKGGKPA